MKYLTIQEIQAIGTFGDDAFDERTDKLMNALLDQEDADPTIQDPDLAGSLTERRVDVQMTVEADDPAAAMTKALCVLRAAIHAIGDFTPGWETRQAVMHVAPADSSDRLFTSA